MTNEMMSLRGLLEKSPDADFLHEMIGFAAQRLMELEVGGLTGAGFGEESPARLAQRNGYRDRDWETRGSATVSVFGQLFLPKSWFPEKSRNLVEFALCDGACPARRKPATIGAISRYLSG